MGSLIVAVLGSVGYGSNLGKTSTSTDITLYDLKKGEDIVTFIEPTRYPERLAPLFFATSIANKAILVVDELNSAFGECTVMLQCSKVTSGYIVLRNYVTKADVEPFIKGTVLENFEFVEDNPPVLGERLLAETQKLKPNPNMGELRLPGTVPVDHSFSVKGIGTVVLGVVLKGAIEKHETVKVLPGKKTAQIRSIQKHDDDFDWACEGERVGLALKNIEVEDLDRGTILTSDSSLKSTTLLKAPASLVRYWSIPIKNGMVLHLGHWMQFVASKVESVTAKEDWRNPVLTLLLEKELIHFPNDEAVITYLDGGKLRVVGIIQLP
ncbi:MAG: EF-Tu/IF-2/RF-3 family GTPase [Candidatus Bathyarchaeota archaeon]